MQDIPDYSKLPDEALIPLRPAVNNLTGLGSTEVYDRISNGRFPAQIKLGRHCSRWRMGDIRSWLADPINWQAPEVAE